MSNFKSFGIYGKCILIIVMIFIRSLLSCGISNQIDKESDSIKTRLYAGMPKEELELIIEQSGWQIEPTSRLFGARKIKGIECNFEFFISSKKNIDTLKILFKLIGRKNIRVLNSYCIYHNSDNVNVYTSKIINHVLETYCSKQLMNVDSLGKREVDSLFMVDQ